MGIFDDAKEMSKLIDSLANMIEENQKEIMAFIKSPAPHAWITPPNMAAVNSTTYIYPDGSMSTDRPYDGQKYTVFDKDQNPTTWHWDNFMEKWCILGNIPVKNKEIVKIVCECGSEKVGGKHSDWCPKWVKDV